MKPFDRLTAQGRLRRLNALARAALARYGLAPDCRLVLVNHSENVTYGVDDPRGPGRRFLRIHRTGYHTRAAIESELAWARALREDIGLATPIPISGLDGAPIQTVAGAGVDEPRHVVLFERVAGRRPSERNLLAPFRRLGALAARLHAHARTWTPPAGFTRFSWDFETTLGRRPHWGAYVEGPGLTGSDRAALARAVEVIRARLAGYGKGPDRFGLIHADLRLDNLLMQAGETRLLDFDDCGFGWRLHDYASAITMIEERPDLPRLTAAWIEGYREVGALGPEDVAMIPTLVMVRRIMVLGWIASHAGTEIARRLGAPYSRGTIGLARRYLDDDFLTRLPA